MTENTRVILNSFGGPLDRPQKLAFIEQGMQAAGLSYDLAETERPGHGTELVMAAVEQGVTTLVAAGGDGTINEVLNGLMHTGHNTACKLGILPLGTANDLATVLNLPEDINQVCKIIAAGKTRAIDVGCVNGHYFANNSAVGMEPMVTITQHEMRWLKGISRYVVAALKVIGQAKTWHMRINWDDDSYDGSVILVSVGNSPRTGGAFYMTPKAEVDDGAFDVVFGHDLSRPQMLTLLPKTFSGNHIDHSQVEYFQTKMLTITTSPSTPLQADGEVIATDATEIRYEIIPTALRVLVE